MACRLAYIYGRSDSYSLPMLLARIGYARSGTEGDSLMPLESWLGTGMFALRFLEWWRTGSGLASASAAPSLYSPPAPPKAPCPTGVPFNHCPVCRAEVKEPMATPAGIVYCAACIRHEDACPVTGEPITKDLLTALYLE